MRAHHRCFGAALVAGVLITGAWAQVSVKLPQVGPYRAWYAGEDTQPRDSVQGDADTLQLGAPPVAGMQLLVLNEKTGNLAMKPTVQIKDGLWKMTNSDFNRIGEVAVRVTHAGKPVASATVNLKGKDLDKVALLSPADKGRASFWGLAPGSYTVVVTYKSDGQAKKVDPAPQYQLALNRSKSSVEFTVDIPDKTEVVGEPSRTPEMQLPAGGAPDAAVGTKLPSNPLGNILVYLVALGIGAAAIFFGMKLLKNNQKLVEEKLAQIGVAIPKDPDPADESAVAPVMPSAPEKVEPIVLDAGVGPIDLAMPVATVASASTSAPMPRLVDAQGNAYFLNDTTVMGREETADIAFPGETTLSRRHAEVTTQNGTISIRDLGSTNGTFVNGVRNDGTPVVLNLGDQVQLGAVKFRYEV